MSNSNNIQGLNFPNIKPSLYKIIDIVKNNIIKKYRNNEDFLRNFSYDNNPIEEYKNKFLNELKILDNYTNDVIHKEKYLLDIISDYKGEKDELYYKIINDYYTIFINHILNKNKKGKDLIFIHDNIDINKRILDMLVNLRYKNFNDNDIIIKMAKTINWVESYSNEIFLLQKIFMKIYQKNNFIYKLIEDKINSKYIKYEDRANNNRRYIPIINEAFFEFINSILRIINTEEKIYELSENDLFDILKVNNDILADVLQLENDLNLYSEEFTNFKEIIKLFEIFHYYEVINLKNIKKVIRYFSNKIKFNNDSKKLSDNFIEFYNFLDEKLKNNKNNENSDKFKVLSHFFLNEFQKTNYDDLKELILGKILENNTLIKYSSEVIRNIIEDKININSEYMIYNIDNLRKEKINIFNMINNKLNIFLDEIIMNIFESKLMIYFESIENINKENEKGILFGNSMKIFEQMIHVLDKISLKNENENNDYNLLCKLYSVAYIKMYLYKFVYFIKNNYNEIDEYKEFMKTLNEIKNKNFGKVIKIYILKLLYYYLDNNLEFLNDFNFNKYNIDVNMYFTSLYNNNKDDILITYFFLPVNQDNYNAYKEKLISFDGIINQNFQSDYTNYIKSIPDIKELDIDDDIDTLLTISINKFFSNLNYISEKDEFLKISSFFNNIFEKKYPNNKELIKLLNLYFDYNLFSNKILKNLIYDRNFYEILLYGFRYCVQSLENDNNNGQNLFQYLLTSEYEKAINQSLIPGNDSQEDLHLITLETIVNHLKTKVDRHGCYVCSCGYYYDIDPCGFPTKNRTFKCPVCEQKIGWGPKPVKKGEETHGMVIRPGHYRIFKDEKQKIGQMKVFDEVDENIPNMLLENYIKEVIEPIRNKSFFGFNSVIDNYFKDKEKKVRNLSQIGYRLLNFISYCHLYFSNLLDVISDDKLNNYLIKNMTIIQIIETDWNILQESLKQRNVSSIEIFMNLIFKELSQMIKDCKFLTKEEEREEFENKVENLIDKCIEEYQFCSYNYIEENKKMLKKIDNYSAETILSELSYPNEEIYPEKDYPMLKYFILTKYKTRDDFIKHIYNNKEKYPLINQLLNIKPEYKKLKFLPAFNEFINYMVDNYSFSITRDEAKEKILSNEKFYELPEFIGKYNKFINSWNEIKDKAIKYKCHSEMPIKDLNSNYKLIYFLNDELELYNGMYIASACQNFIYWQNSFLSPIIETYEKSGILNCYINNMKNKIRLQDSTPGQILSIDERFKNSKFENLNDVIYSFSHRNIFGYIDKINYSDYNTFIYDYDKIEAELGKILLPGLHLFENEEELNFVTFCFEGFRGKNSQILANFISKYPQKDINDEEKDIIIKYIKSKNNTKYDFKECYNLLQKLIIYLSERITIKEDEKIANILENYPENFKLSDNYNDFFYSKINELAIDKIMNLFFYFEHLCYEDLIKNLQDEYIKEIPSKIKIDIINKIKEYKEDNLSSIAYLGAPVRRFISRYLIGRTDIFDIKENRDLAFELTREDLWEEKFKKNNLIDNIIEQIHCFKLTVNQAYSFYELIGDEDKKSLLF